MFSFFEELFAPGRKHTSDERKRLELSRIDQGVGDPHRGPIDLASGKVTVRPPGRDTDRGTDPRTDRGMGAGTDRGSGRDTDGSMGSGAEADRGADADRGMGTCAEDGEAEGDGGNA
ncbi:DUF6191 domain-containing protein [Streptomyces sp. YPW6]|uniref:DUF6191 domain-containing protein n=1 Tax=Streptomyces sp. YPW6 TaxID=2840373 RepID=UPI001C0BF392|nr:DUF6191 domain-containing protein [Streptomyces sp. YPW6]QWQ40974.1 hypothetical protein KME66_08040 [Streptomyces sp. YPW6]